MKRNLINFALIAGVLAITGTTAFAQNLKATIPFEFQVSDKVMPAGAYDLYRLNSLVSGWTMRSVNTRDAAMVIAQSTAPARATAKREKGELVFRCVGASCALESLYAPGSTSGHAFRYKLRNVDPTVQVTMVRIAFGD